jgi:zinc D-Ala-D-Ala carboxypeptidase
MNLSGHLSLAEFTTSDTAERLGIDNDLPLDLLEEGKRTGSLLDRIQAELSTQAGYEVPILLSSGYRCPALNKSIGSGPGSDHPRAMAFDFRAPAFGTPLAICQALQPKLESLGIGQLIFEHTWVHVSTRSPANSVNAVLTLQGKGYSQGIPAA